MGHFVDQELGVAVSAVLKASPLASVGLTTDKYISDLLIILCDESVFVWAKFFCVPGNGTNAPGPLTYLYSARYNPTGSRKFIPVSVGT